jgi:two-component system response regulator YesN
VRCALVEINQFGKWMNDFEDVEIQMRRLSVRKVIEEVIGSEHLFKIFDEDIHRFGIILTRDMINKDRQCLENLKWIIDQNCQCSVSVALSEEGKGINNLGELYRQAVLAMQYRLFQREEGLLYYEQFKNLPLNYCFYESDPDELLKHIISNNISGINDKINTVFSNFYEKKCAPQVIANYIKNLEFELVKHVQEHKGSVDEIIIKLEKLNATIGKTPITSLRDEFYKIILCISDYYKSIRNKGSRDIIIDIKDFVHKNYQKDLKLQQIAKDYYVNPVYLGQVFAKTVGKHFNEYLHSVRIEEAKKLLRRTNVKISAIAVMVGYSDSEYFVSKFKAAVRQLPSDYRKKHQDKNLQIQAKEG